MNMNLYCCGGAGINIGKDFSKYDGVHTPGFAPLTTYFIDGSRSNLTNDIPEKNVYLFEGLNGSGKLRKSNYEEFANRGKDVLREFKPGDLNVIIHSTSGGTGSVCGCVIAAELLSRDIPVVVLTVGSTNSQIEATNTINTLKSYEVISQKHGVPVVMMYHENSQQTPRPVVDNLVMNKIVKLAALFSGQNKELDREDLRNFLNYTRVTSYGARLTYMDITCVDLPKLNNQQNIVSVATLADEGANTDLSELVDYHTVGYLDKDSDLKNKLADYKSPMHFSLIVGHFNTIIDTLEQKKKEFVEKTSAYVDKGIAKNVTDATEEGIIL